VALPGVVVFAAVLFFKRYLGEKAKNLATKEDIGEITREVESVKHDYNALLEHLKVRNQLRMAALDKRLQVHQEAFTKWHRLISAIGEDQMEAAAKECRDWWTLNCIYLEPKIRDGLLEAVNREYMRRATKSIDV
jgi:hypothetical protein